MLSAAQRKYLKGLAHGLKPVVFIGQRGVSEALEKAMNEALDAHELIKGPFCGFQGEGPEGGHLRGNRKALRVRKDRHDRSRRDLFSGNRKTPKSAKSFFGKSRAMLSITEKAAFLLYDLAWKGTVPFLSRNKRMAEGLDQRKLKIAPPRSDVWIQAASAGESYLARSILGRLGPAETVAGPGHLQHPAGDGHPERTVFVPCRQIIRAENIHRIFSIRFAIDHETCCPGRGTRR